MAVAEATPQPPGSGPSNDKTFAAKKPRLHSGLAGRFPFKTAPQALSTNRNEVVFDTHRASGRSLVMKGRDAKFKPESDAPSGGDLWIRDASGNDRLVDPSVYHARFSPDGTKIAYATSDCVMRVEDLQGKRLFEVPRAYEPTWSPDGKTIAFADVPEGREVHQPGTTRLALCDSASGKINGYLTDGKFDDGRPEFSPTGDQIVFVSGGRSGIASFWMIPTKGGEPQQITNVGLETSHTPEFVPTPYHPPTWSPDRHSLAYDFKSGTTEQVYVLQFRYDGNFDFTLLIGNGLSPKWESDGTLSYQQQSAPDVATSPQQNNPGANN